MCITSVSALALLVFGWMTGRASDLKILALEILKDSYVADLRGMQPNRE